jgi:exodeoxyribonuclease VII small subunit
MRGSVDPLDAVDPEQLSFEELVTALEALTDQLASGQIGIEEAADLYERAERLHRLAAQRLARVQARIDSLGTGSTTGSGTGSPPG